jgi:hypothetical protein
MTKNQDVPPTKDFDQPTKPKAYSDVRFSTPEQADGDSLHGHRSSTSVGSPSRAGDDERLTFHHEGMSAYWRRNAADGELAAFLQAARDRFIRATVNSLGPDAGAHPPAPGPMMRTSVGVAGRRWVRRPDVGVSRTRTFIAAPSTTLAAGPSDGQPTHSSHGNDGR